MTIKDVFKGTLIVLLTLAIAYTLVISVHIIIVLLIAIVIASAIRPLVQWLTAHGVPQGMAITMTYLGLALIIVSLFVAVLPPVVNQIIQYIENDARLAYRIIRAQRWIESTISGVTNNDVSLVSEDSVREAVSDFVAQFRSIMPSMLEDIGTTLGQAVLIFVMGAYWLTSHEKATAFVKQLTPPAYRDNVETVIGEIETTMGSYVRGLFLIASIVGLLNFVTLELLGVPNALTLAVIIAVTTTIPMLGGFVGGAMAVFMTLVAAPEYVLHVLVTFFVVTQIENYLLSPRIMARQVGLDPLLVIVYTAIGFIMFGVVGAVIAVPIMGTLHILLVHLVIEPYRESIRSFQTQDGLPVVRASLDSAPTRSGPVLQETR